MKRCDRKRRLYLLRISYNREKRRCRKLRPPGGPPTGYYQIHAPRSVGVADLENRRALLLFLQNLREHAVKLPAHILIDFSGTEQMYADGALLLTAELSRLLHIGSLDLTLRCLPSHDTRVSQVLKQIGVYELLRYRGKIEPKLEDVIHWCVAQGTGALGERSDDILGRYHGVIPEKLSAGLYTGITEAMTNTRHHAYLSPRADGLGKLSRGQEWWMFSQERLGRLHVVFCDLGIGIPNSLPQTKPRLWKEIVRLGRSDDGATIAEAVKESRTRTGNPYQGKGLGQLVSVVEETEGGFIQIHSNHGCYTYRKGRPTIVNYRESILGTLISWSLPIKR